MIARRITVSGRVQGVCFRDWTVSTAQAGGIAGWVRNRRDGSVEIMAEGEAGAIGRFTDACRHGPPAARVNALTVEEVEPDGASAFERRATA